MDLIEELVHISGARWKAAVGFSPCKAFALRISQFHSVPVKWEAL